LFLRRKFQRVTDYFALFNEARRPWIEPEALKQKFLALASDAHPDRVHNAGTSEKSAVTQRYTELNAAYHCLLEPKSRLRHLLELELGAKPKDVQQIPAALANLFAEVATACQIVDIFLAEKRQATSPLLQVQLFERAQEWIQKLNPLQRKLNELRENLTSELKSLDDAWTKEDEAARKKLLKNLEELYRLSGYLNRWNNQIQERVVQLTL
jgi:DnaJ-domain-containing protein 1